MNNAFFDWKASEQTTSLQVFFKRFQSKTKVATAIAVICA